jgi:3-oxoacyl-[acyl-carrier-protein] synthase-3
MAQDNWHNAAVLLGSGASLPSRVVRNEELAAILDTSDEWIRKRTGIGSRRWADEGVATSDLAVDAGARALRSADLDRVDAVIVATTTPDRWCPATAPEVAARLGMIGVAAYDIHAVCTGFIYALANGVGLITAGVAKTVLVIGAETYSTIVDPNDRGTAVLFGDGAGAVVLGPGVEGDRGSVGPFLLGSDGTQADLIEIPAGGSRQRSSRRPAGPADHYFQFDGPDVYRLAIETMSAAADTLIERAGLSYEEVDLIAPHQANRRISDALARRIGMDTSKVLSNVELVGNTAAASIPLLLAEAGADGRIKAGQRLLLTAFGGGLTWGAALLVWPEIMPENGELAAI